MMNKKERRAVLSLVIDLIFAAVAMVAGGWYIFTGDFLLALKLIEYPFWGIVYFSIQVLKEKEGKTPLMIVILASLFLVVGYTIFAVYELTQLRTTAGGLLILGIRIAVVSYLVKEMRKTIAKS
ncbi:hypothetical protein [Lactococcus termiticola]|uniref:Uncharacterized protein n=1 Tax=Lactococcus termiticola TaxID=2169526 RepID=A0A2R5HII2_9LACT|nr:hypothetical protein [Lactococcus termiticola]GBG96138.1 hypothetical protein NtB2_00243 [Lactococcus termiticola]